MSTLSPLLKSGISISAIPTIVPNTPIINTAQFAGGYSLPNTLVDTSIEDQIIRVRGAKELKRYQFPPDLPKYNMTLIENDIYLSRGNITALTPERIYKLPLPNPMTDVFSIAYKTEFSVLNGTFDAVTQGAQITAAVVGGIRGVIVGAAIGGAPGAVIGGAAGAAGGYFIAGATVDAIKAIGGTIDNIISLGGVKVNTFKTVTLDSPEYRQFELNWKLVPRNYKESVQIQSLITSLKRGSAVRFVSGPRGETVPGLFAFPKIYLLHFQPNVKFLYKFKPAVLRSISVHYDGGSGTPSFYAPQPLKTAAAGSALAAQQLENNQNAIQNSPPESVIINTNWLEIEYWKNDDYKSDPNDKEMSSSFPYDAVNDDRGIR